MMEGEEEEEVGMAGASPTLEYPLAARGITGLQ
jgi:hypothetical protein